MTRVLFLVFLALLFPVSLRADKYDGREANPFAPSLPQLTDEEEDEIDRVIDRFIRFDTGRLTGAEGKKALIDFHKLGPETIFGLIRGLNKAAKIEASCPALTIGKKLAAMLRATNDVQLLEFARENIGAGVGKTRHGGLLNDLRVCCMVRKRVAANTALAKKQKKGEKPLRSLSVSELAAAVTKEKGSRLKVLLTELAGRKGNEVVNALGSAAAARDKDTVALARRLLTSHLGRLTEKSLKEKLKDERIEIRLAAARAAGAKRFRLGDELIQLLADNNMEIRQAAHQSLLKLSKGMDYGPRDNPSEEDWSQAAKAWQGWWDKAKAR